MTPRTLFAIIIKTIALYLLIGSFVAIPQFINSMLFLFQPTGMNPNVLNDLMIPLIFLLLIAGLYLICFRLCFYRTDWIISKLRLDQGFDDEIIGINLHRSTLLKIIITVTGALIIADSLPLVFKYLIFYFQDSKINYQNSAKVSSTGWLIYYFVKFMFGFFFLTCSRIVVNFIELKRKA